MDFGSRQASIKKLLTCPICEKLCKEVTAIEECCHIFCKKCIVKKITEENLRSCPVCNIDLGVAPLQKLRADYRWQSMRNSFKDKRRELIEVGLIQGKGKQPHEDTREAEELAVVPSDTLPIRRKEKSLSSFMSTDTASIQTPVNGRRKSSGRKALPPRRAPLYGVAPIEPMEIDHPETSSKGGYGKKQNSKPSKQNVPDIRRSEQSIEPLDGMNDLVLKPLDCLEVEVWDTSKANKSSMLQSFAKSSHSNAHEDKAKKPMSKIKEYTSNFRVQDDENGSDSVPGKSKNVHCGKQKRVFLTEDLNIPAKVVLDPTSSDFRRVNRVWFCLVASDEQESYAPLPPMPPYYLRVKDINMPASYVNKYLVTKLGLYSEDEVEISLLGQPIPPHLLMLDLMDLWVQKAPRSLRRTAITGDPADDFVMVLSYARRLRALPY